MLRVKLSLLAYATLLFASVSALAAPPDLTASGVPGDSRTFNLGPTGVRGWVYHVREDSSESRQIQVTAVESGSPAEGILAVDDVILGADGLGAVPVNFSSDARRSFGLAIADAEAQTPATLKLLVWRAGSTFTADVSLQTMGTYSATAPYNCPKSQLILEQGLQYLMANETAGRYSFGTLSLLSANDPDDPENAARMARAQTEARALVPSAEVMTQMMSAVRDTASPWERGHALIVLAEYYLATNDAEVLPAIEAYAVNIARNHSMFGTAGHIFAEKNPDGSDNGPMGGGYGAVNSSGLPCYLGLLLARECGLTYVGFQSTTEALVEAAIERASRFFAYYAGRGAIPYGEHEPYWSSHESNGKSGLAAICFALEDNRVGEAHFYARMAVAATSEREQGHTGSYFNYLWSPLGAACGGEMAAASHFSRISWMLDLNRRWDGGFDYDCINGEGPQGGAPYYDFRMSTAALLVYALPLRQLRITGQGHDSARWLSSAEVTEAAATDGYDAKTKGTSELITDLGSWSPKVQRRAAEQLATRVIDAATLALITELATDPASGSRIGAAYALGRMSDSSTANARAATLAGLLTDFENHVRFIAAEAMRYLPQTAKVSQLGAILSAAASTGSPLLPYDEEDPLHFAHGRIAILLFYSGNAYGPKGVIWGSGINGVDRGLLYPAISAVAANPVGQARSTLGQTYLNLSAADVDALAGTLVDSVHFGAPADKMFSAGIRTSGIQILQNYDIAEGVPLAMAYMVSDGRGSSYTSALGVLKDYAGSVTTVRPEPDVVGFCKALLGGPNAADAQAVLDAIAADSAPVTLTPFKSVQSVAPDTASLTLPSSQTNLRATAIDLAWGDLVYTWRKVHGAGNVAFTPNGTLESMDTAITFENAPGQYLFEVTVSDSRGFTEVSDTVAITLYDTDGSLPANNPPTAHPQSVATAPATVTPITLTGSDPEAYALIFSVTSQPAHGYLSGAVPDLIYSADSDYIGEDSFTFQVMDSEGQVSGATVSIMVSASGVELFAYEPFNYATGNLQGQGGGVGMSGSWADGPETPGKAYVHDESSAVTSLDTGAGKLSWDGVVDNLPTLPASGARYVGLSPVDIDKWEAYRPLAQSAGAMAAGNDNVLWVSVVSHYKGGGYGAHFGLALGTNSFTNRSQNLSTSASYGNGTAGNGIGVGGTFNNSAITPVVYNGGSVASRTTIDAATLSATVDNVIVLKYVFGATDTVYAWSFPENDALDETVFDANAISASGTVDENNLNILTFSGVRGAHAIDEIRIGNSFASVIGVGEAPSDTTPPTLAAANIVDNRAGEPVTQNTPVSYSVTFSEAMDASSVDVSDFGNAGTSGMMIDSIIQSLPNVFVVQVTPTTAGSLQLQVNAGAGMTDLAGNSLDTTLAITDDRAITVNAASVSVPDVVGLTQAAAVSTIASVGLTVGAIANQYHASIPAGEVLSQNPVAGTGVSLGALVSFVISLGPNQAGDFSIADIPVSGIVAGNHADTHASDDSYETLTETRSRGGSPQSVSSLEHKWLFELAGGDTVSFHVEAFHTPNSEGDNFTFAYSTTGVNGTYLDMLTVTKTSDVDTEQTFSMPDGTSGTIYVRVVDADRRRGGNVADTLYIDRMYFKSVSEQTDVEIWQARYPAADLSDLLADFDGDGLSNGDERLWGLDPTSAASANPFADASKLPYGTFTYSRRDPSRTGASYSVWTSGSLVSGSWVEDVDAGQVVSSSDVNHVQIVTVTLSAGLLDSPRLFVQVVAEE